MAKQVSSDDFYKVINPLDVTLFIANDKWPYKTVFKLKRTQAVVGWQDTDGKYYISECK